MALTVTTRLTDDGNKSFKMRLVNLAFDSAYPAGGEALTAAEVDLASITAIFPAVNGANFAVWDRTNSKLQLFTADGTEATGDQSAVSVEAIVLGA